MEEDVSPKYKPNIPRTSLDRYGEIAYRTAYNPDYATPWEKLGPITKRKYKAMAKAVLTELWSAMVCHDGLCWKYDGVRHCVKIGSE